MIRGVFSNFRSICRTSCLIKPNEEVFKYIPTPVENSIAKEDRLPTPRKIDRDTLVLLEKYSLVGIENEKALQTLEEAIAFADQIFEVDTTDVEPLYTVLEDEYLYLREDVIESDVTRKELISLSKVTKENFFVTPQGNFDYILEEKKCEPPVVKKASSENL